MNPIGFEELGAIADMRIPSQQEIAAANPGECPGRGTEGTTKTGHTIALCATLTATAGRSVAVDRNTCKVCVCNGVADIMKNCALQKHILQTAYSATIAGEDILEPVSPDDVALAVAIENVKQWAGDDIARRFVDTLVYHESVTAEKALELLSDHDLVEVG